MVEVKVIPPLQLQNSVCDRYPEPTSSLVFVCTQILIQYRATYFDLSRCAPMQFLRRSARYGERYSVRHMAKDGSGR